MVLSKSLLLQHTPVASRLDLLIRRGHSNPFLVAFTRLSFLRARLRSRRLDLDLAGSRVASRNHAHNLVSEFSEQSTLEGFGHVVPDHVPRRAPFH